MLCITHNISTLKFSDYLNDEKATEATTDVDGWLHTGDIGYVDDDGEIFLVDRARKSSNSKAFRYVFLI